MVIVHLTLALSSVVLLPASDFTLHELNPLLSMQNRQGATQQLTEESQTIKVTLPEKVSFCPHFCGSPSAQHGRGCCVEKDGGMKFWASTKTNRDKCETSPNPSVWCTAGQNPWPGTNGNMLMKIAGWDCETQEGWHLGGATDVVCDLPTLTAVAIDVSPFTDLPFPPTPAPTSAPTPPAAEWDLILEGFKCTGQIFGTYAQCSQFDCEQLAIQRQHPFYQYQARKGICVTEESCFTGSRIEALGWAIYRDDNLWPLKAQSQSCSSKRKDIRIAASQMACQQAALDRVKPGTNVADPATYYTWNAYSKKCRVSKKCNNKTEKDNFATYQNPRQMASKGL